jgi:hypothetical protein
MPRSIMKSARFWRDIEVLQKTGKLPPDFNT